MENQEKKRRSRKKKADHKAYDEYVANVSNGMNPPSAEKRRKRKKQQDPEAYDRYLQESEPEEVLRMAELQAESRRSRRMRAEAEAEKAAEETAVQNAGPDAVQTEMALETEPAAEEMPEDYDAYLLHEDEAEEEAVPERRRHRRRRTKHRRMSGKARRARRRKMVAIAYICAMALILVGFGVMGVKQLQEYRRFEHMRQVVEDQRFYEGTKVDGYDVSGMTLAEAEAFFAASIEPQFRNRQATLTTGEMFTAEQLGYTSNYSAALRAAWSSGRNGSLEERYEAIMNGEHAAASYSVSRTFYTDEGVQKAVAQMAQRINQDQEDPTIEGFDPATAEFTFTEGRPGYELNQEKLISDISYVMANGGGKVEPLINAIPVEIDKEKLLTGYGRISYISTDASSSSANRLTNLDLACRAISGYRLEPGAEFSFNGIVGKRTADKGYKEAPVYNSDGMDLGGGICQVGSTLFNAAVMADMEITDRQPHSRPVSYLPKGQDAAINWGNQDLKFVNVTDSPVYIFARVTPDMQVECAVYGKFPEDGHTVVIKSHVYEKLKYETITQIDMSMAPGTHKVDKKGRTGYKAKAWKVTLDKNGNEIASEHLCYSTYDKQDEWIRFNP